MSSDVLSTGIAALLAATEHPYPDMRPLAAALTNAAQTYQGSVTGTGAAIDVDTPGNPKAVIMFNRSDPTLALKLKNMATDYGMKLTDAPALTYAAAICTLGTGKFTIGADTDLNVSSEVIEYLAVI